MVLGRADGAGGQGRCSHPAPGLERGWDQALDPPSRPVTGLSGPLSTQQGMHQLGLGLGDLWARQQEHCTAAVPHVQHAYRSHVCSPRRPQAGRLQPGSCQPGRACVCTPGFSRQEAGTPAQSQLPAGTRPGSMAQPCGPRARSSPAERCPWSPSLWLVVPGGHPSPQGRSRAVPPPTVVPSRRGPLAGSCRFPVSAPEFIPFYFLLMNCCFHNKCSSFSRPPTAPRLDC